MPDEVIPAGTVAPVVATVTPAPVVAAPAVAPPVVAAPVAAAPAAPAHGATAAAEPPPDPNWLNTRIAQAKASASTAEQNKIFRELGVTNLEEAKAKVTAANTAADALKTKEQKLTEENAALKTRALAADELEIVVSERAALEMGQLSEAQQTAIKAMPGVGDKAAAQLKAINSLRAGGFITTAPPAQAAVAVAAPAARAAVAAPASTTAAGGAPPPASSAEPDHKATYASLLKTNPMQAAVYADRFGKEVFTP